MRRGFSLVELLTAIVVAVIILGAITGLFIGSNNAFRTGRNVSGLTEDVRNAISTLEFVFSRWGAGVPCKNNNCTTALQNIKSGTLPDCDGYPPTDPMCITAGSDVRFYANLYGIGFVVSVSGNNANVISCRLSNNSKQNCYYVWNGGRTKFGTGTDGRLVFVRLSGISGEQDCLGGTQTISISGQVYEWVTLPQSTTLSLSPGDYITRVPHGIRLYVSNGVLYMDRTDMADSCGDSESAVKIGNVQSFNVQKVGRAVRVDAVFVGSDGKTYPITRYFGR